MGKQADISLEEDGRMGIQFIKEGNRILIGLDLELTDNRWVEGVNPHILIVPPEGIGRHRPTTWSWSWISVVYGEGHREIDAPPPNHAIYAFTFTHPCYPSLLALVALSDFLAKLLKHGFKGLSVTWRLLHCQVEIHVQTKKFYYSKSHYQNESKFYQLFFMSKYTRYLPCALGCVCCPLLEIDLGKNNKRLSWTLTFF